jgi:ubiquinone/menaquinone biosynthesis C-methylase UbiE
VVSLKSLESENDFLKECSAMVDKEKIKFFDSKAWGWDRRNHLEDKLQIRKLVNKFSLKPNDLVLDIGTGNGVLLPYLSPKVNPGGRILALDISWKMIAWAKKNNRHRNLRFMNASAEAMPVKDQKLDCITCFATFAHVCDKMECLKEMARILKKGGRLYIAHLLGKKELAHHHKNTGRVVMHDILPEDSMMKKMMTACGFKNIRIIDRPDLYLASARK